MCLRKMSLNDLMLIAENLEQVSDLDRMCSIHRYLIYTRWCIPHCGQAKIEAELQALVVLTELTERCVFCIAETDKVDIKCSFMRLISI